MNIREIEDFTGMSRANVHFYENEGLISPVPNEKGYRIYTYEDGETLKKIKLLRLLHISLEDIKGLHTGKEELQDVLKKCIAAPETGTENMEAAYPVCRAMVDDGAAWQTLEPQKYIDLLGVSGEGEREVLASDSIPREGSPWRRYFARSFDATLYGVLWSIFLSQVLSVYPFEDSYLRDAIDIIVVMIMMLLIEPLLLARLGTTPGKWIMGFRVTARDGRRLSYGEGLARTWLVLWKGEGLSIPIYGLVRQYKSYAACTDGQPLAWEEDSQLILRDKKKLRALGYVTAYAALMGIMIFSFFVGGRPPHSGDISAKEFYENFNHQTAYYDTELGAELSEKGKWTGKDKETIDDFSYDAFSEFRPEITVTETGGAVSAVELQFETEDNTTGIPNFATYMRLSAKAFPWPKGEDGTFSGACRSLIDMIGEHPFESFQFSEGGVTAVCEIKYKGYEDVDPEYTDVLFPQEDAKSTSYSFCFRISK